MKLSPRCRALILSDMEPGRMYRECLTAMAEEGVESDYALTEIVVYATEIRYALNVLRHGRPDAWTNFGDLKGDADEKLWATLDPIHPLNLAFIGSGPYPVSAFQVRERYPHATITCVDNSIVAYLMSKALTESLDLSMTVSFGEAIDVDYAPYSAVIVAAMVSGKQALVEKILRTSSAQIVLRGNVDVTDDRLIQMPATFGDNGALCADTLGRGLAR